MQGKKMLKLLRISLELNGNRKVQDVSSLKQLHCVSTVGVCVCVFVHAHGCLCLFWQGISDMG